MLNITPFDGSPEKYLCFKFQIDLKVAHRKTLTNLKKLEYFFDCLTDGYKTDFILKLSPDANFSFIFGLNFYEVYAIFKNEFESVHRILAHMDQKFSQILPLQERKLSFQKVEQFIHSLRPIALICAPKGNNHEVIAKFQEELYARLPVKLYEIIFHNKNFDELVSYCIEKFHLSQTHSLGSYI